jgi:Na+:H+ antiporter, NhaA family
MFCAMANDSERLHRTWLHSDRAIPTRFVRPALRFADTEAASGIVLLAAAVIALLWANSPWGESYFTLWETHLTIHLGPFHFDEALKEVVNDGLMAIFFFVVGMEIKRELVIGELSGVRRAALPALAALGGMIVPALIYVSFVAGSGGDALNGWGIPMATDIAFSVGVIALVGSRVPVGAKLFLLALAIVDDIGAILVIALFYTASLSIVWIGVAAGVLALVFAARQVGIRSLALYLPLAAIVWFAFLESGVHATIAGVILGLMIPAHAWYSDADFRRRAGWILERFDMDSASPDARERLNQDALELAAIARESVPPIERYESALLRFSSFVVVPIFALANAGIRFGDFDVVEAVFSPIALGVSVGLVLGKPIGITVATWIGLRLNLGELPRGVRFGHVIGIGMLAGVGFTVSLFIAELAFRDSATGAVLTDEAKIGIFLGSAIAGTVGYLVMRRITASRPGKLEPAGVAGPR